MDAQKLIAELNEYPMWTQLENMEAPERDAVRDDIGLEQRVGLLLAGVEGLARQVGVQWMATWRRYLPTRPGHSPSGASLMNQQTIETDRSYPYALPLVFLAGRQTIAVERPVRPRSTGPPPPTPIGCSSVPAKAAWATTSASG